jgi:hypothetical protein
VISPILAPGSPHRFVEHYQEICDRLLDADAGLILSGDTFPKRRPSNRQKEDNRLDQPE